MPSEEHTGCMRMPSQLTLKATWFLVTLLRIMRLFFSFSPEPKLSSSAGLEGGDGGRRETTTTHTV